MYRKCRAPDREGGSGRRKNTNDELEKGYENESDSSD